MTDSAPWRRGLVCNDSSKRQIRPDSWQRFPRIPRGQARERVLFDLVQQFSKMDMEDPEWLRYKLSVVEWRARNRGAAIERCDGGTGQTQLRDT